MKQYTFTDRGFTFKRINKQTARRAYMNGLTVMLCPCNLRSFTPYHPEYIINRKDREHMTVDKIGMENMFNTLVNSFEYYNCSNAAGKYTAFYIPVRSVDRFTGKTPTTATLATVEEYDYNYMQ